MTLVSGLYKCLSALFGWTQANIYMHINQILTADENIVGVYEAVCGHESLTCMGNFFSLWLLTLMPTPSLLTGACVHHGSLYMVCTPHSPSLAMVITGPDLLYKA
jgi:hypothetical protein